MLPRVIVPFMLAACAAGGATLSGRVVEDHTGLPLASATLRVSRPGQTFLAAELETDREGRFQAADLPEGEYRLEVAKPNFGKTELPVTLGPGSSNISARLIRLGVITGRVHDVQNQPVAGVIVMAIAKPPGDSPLRPPGRNTPFLATADARGEYRIRGLPPGDYVVVSTFGASTRHIGSMGRATTPDNLGSAFLFYPTNARPEVLPITGGEEHRNIDFTLQAGTLRTVTGKVETSKPEKWFWVGLVDPRQPSVSVAVADTDKEGAFRFNGIAEGSYRLVAVESARARSFAGGMPTQNPVFGQTRVNVGAQNVEGVTVQPNDARSVEFALVAATGCQTSTQLQLTPLEDWGSILDRTISVAAGKTAAVTGLAPMRYLLSTSPANAACSVETETILDLSETSPSAPVEVRLAAGAAVSGKLDTAGRPPASFAIVLTRAEDAGAVQIAPVDAQARFSFSGLRPGRYRIGAYPAGGKLPNIARMFEFELRGGSNAGIDLAAPLEAQ